MVCCNSAHKKIDSRGFFLKPEFIQVSRPGLKSTGDTWIKDAGRVSV